MSAGCELSFTHLCECTEAKTNLFKSNFLPFFCVTSKAEIHFYSYTQVELKQLGLSFSLSQ